VSKIHDKVRTPGRRRTVIIGLTLYAVTLGVVGCDSNPKSLQECLLMAAKKESGKAVRQADRLCREIFPDKATGIPSGAFYFVDTELECTEFRIMPDGKLDASFCTEMGLIEQLEDGGIAFSCKTYGTTGETEVFDLVRDGRLIRVIWDTGKPATVLHPTLSECVRSITPERRTEYEARKAKKAEAEEAKRAAEMAAEAKKLKAEKNNRIERCCNCLANSDCGVGAKQRCLPEGLDDCKSRLGHGRQPILGGHPALRHRCGDSCAGTLEFY